VSESIEETVACELESEDATAGGPYEQEPTIGPGSLIGRYVVLSLLGRGGMGFVVAAYDPDLDRKVALKLLRPRGDSASAARARLQREAQALAKLDHPNVVGVHDVGVHDDQLFVAMDFVDGQTLGEWLAGSPQALEREASPHGARRASTGGLQGRADKPWREVVRVFVEAGLGLAAAHEAGLVHRDFKPDNVMIGDDGRVRVMDFGLARPESGDDVRTPTRASPSANGETLDRITQTGALLGTPAYMSPEQFRGGTIDARSDQFGFCVALYEGLYGERPFSGRSVGQIAAAVEAGEIREAPRGSTVPTWLRRVVVRGLAQAPEGRWPSMRELLSALAGDPAARRRKWLAGASLVALLAAASVGLVSLVGRAAGTCTGMDDKLAGIWDDARRAELEAALLGTKLRHAPATWVRVQKRLDDYAEAWVTARTEACEATHRGEQSGELLDLRMGCLDDRLEHLRAAVEVLARADATVAGQAVSLVAALPSLELCADQAALTAEVPPPDDPEVATKVQALERELVDAHALERAGKYGEALTLADAVVTEAETLGYEPLLARALRRQGSLRERTGAFEQAEATLVRAYELALAQRMLSDAAGVSATLMFLVGDTLVRPDEGRRWAIDADALSRAAYDGETRASYLNARGALAAAAGEYDESRAYYERALALLERSLGPEHPSVANTVYNLGNIAVAQFRFEQARDLYARALAIYETALGPEHPDVAACLVNRAGIDIELGELERARIDLDRSLSILESSVGPDHPEVATALNALGGLARMQGDPRASRGYFERALAIIVDSFGAQHPHVAIVHSNLGDLAAELGERDEARRHYELALEIRRATLGPEHLSVGGSLDDLGLLALDEGRDAEAAELFERSLEIQLPGLGEGHIDVANTRFALARALWATQPERAREQAGLARAAYLEMNPAPPLLAELEAWLRTR
jgi:tetratricopeptide (TPR) repeat protein/tRNA A-37 threonylcarbamoyl transferase component Bud32